MDIIKCVSYMLKKKTSDIMFLTYMFDINFVVPKFYIMILINISTCTCLKQIGHFIKRNISVCLHMFGCWIRMSLNTRLVYFRIELIKRKIIYAWHEFSNTVECRYNAIQYSIICGTAATETVNGRATGLFPDMYSRGLRMRREFREHFPRHCELEIPTCITLYACRTWRHACRDR